MSYTSLALLAKQAKFDENKQKHEVKQRALDAERCLQSKQGQKPAKNPCETTIFTSCRIRPLFCLQNKQNCLQNKQKHEVKQRVLDAWPCLRSTQGSEKRKNTRQNNVFLQPLKTMPGGGVRENFWGKYP